MTERQKGNNQSKVSEYAKKIALSGEVFVQQEERRLLNLNKVVAVAGLADIMMTVVGVERLAWNIKTTEDTIILAPIAALGMMGLTGAALAWEGVQRQRQDLSIAVDEMNRPMLLDDPVERPRLVMREFRQRYRQSQR